MTRLQQPPPQKMPICTVHTNYTSRPTVEEFNKHQQLLPFSSNLANEAQHFLRSSVLCLMNEFSSARDSRGRTCNLCTGNIAESDGSKGGYLQPSPENKLSTGWEINQGEWKKGIKSDNQSYSEGQNQRCSWEPLLNFQFRRQQRQRKAHLYCVQCPYELWNWVCIDYSLKTTNKGQKQNWYIFLQRLKKQLTCICSVELLLSSSPDSESLMSLFSPSACMSLGGEVLLLSGLLLRLFPTLSGGESARVLGNVELLVWWWLLLLWRSTSSATTLQWWGLPKFWLASLGRAGGVTEDGDGVEEGDGRPKLDISGWDLLRFSLDARQISRTVGLALTAGFCGGMSARRTSLTYCAGT